MVTSYLNLSTNTIAIDVALDMIQNVYSGVQNFRARWFLQFFFGKRSFEALFVKITGKDTFTWIIHAKEINSILSLYSRDI